MNNFDMNSTDSSGLTPFEASLPMMLYRVLDAIMPAYRALFAEYGLTEQQWRVLRTLWDSESLSSTELAARTLIPAASLVGVLDRLERKGLIARIRSVADRRVMIAKLSAEGRSLEQQISPRLETIQASVRACVSPAEWQKLTEILKEFEAGPRSVASQEEDRHRA
ncbi:MAG: hypothetical protein CMF26_01195 [Kiloniella sp.]|nr:hypothetical protein [Kiloniella sp.]